MAQPARHRVIRFVPDPDIPSEEGLAQIEADQAELDREAHPPDEGGAGPGDGDMNYDDMAKQYIRMRGTLKGVPTIWFWSGLFWHWTPTNPVYTSMTEPEMVDSVLNWMIETRSGSDIGVARCVMACVRCKIRLPSVDTMPMWLGTRHTHGNHALMRNGIADPVDLATGQTNSIQGHTPRWFCGVMVPYKYDINARCPLWDRVLDELLVKDPEKIALLQEWMGYILTPDTSRQVALFLIGPGGTGKSTLIHIMTELLGEPNCSAVGLAELGSEYGAGATRGKALNVSSEVPRNLGITHEAAFKWYTGGGAVNMNIKYVDRLHTNIKPTARLVVSVNEFPKFRDTTEAVYRRILTLPMDYRIPVRDPGMWVRLESELPGIFNWAIKGLGRLLRAGWTKVRAGSQLLAHLRLQNQPWEDFVTECVIPGPGTFTSYKNLMDRYMVWGLRAGVTLKDPDQGVVVDAIKRVVPDLVTGARGRVAGVQYRGIVGARVKTN